MTRAYPHARPLRPRLAVAGLALSLFASDVGAESWVVCPESATGADCRFHGGAGLQQAVDAAADGDHVLVRKGRYRADHYRDVSFGDLVIRGRVLVQGKSITITGEPGTVLQATGAVPASALVVHEGELTLRHLAVRDARAASPDDDVYDGHGVFVVNGMASIEDVTFQAIEKMALSIRGESRVTASGVRMLKGHVGVWIEEGSSLNLEDCIIANNDSAAVAAYADARVAVKGCVFERNLDDALYGAERATISATDSLFIGNAPFAVRAVDDAAISVSDSTFYANDEDRYLGEGSGASIRSSRTFPSYCSAQEERHSESAPSDCSQ